jgi:hypothetical protein
MVGHMESDGSHACQFNGCPHGINVVAKCKSMDLDVYNQAKKRPCYHVLRQKEDLAEI